MPTNMFSSVYRTYVRFQYTTLDMRKFLRMHMSPCSLFTVLMYFFIF